MRAIAIGTLFLLTLPAASALLAPQPAAPSSLPDLPAEITDGDVLMLLAAHRGMSIERLPVIEAPLDMPLSDAVSLVADRAGVTVSAEDLAAFDALDPRVQQPVATMLLAMHEAWILRDEALGDIPRAEVAVALRELGRGEAPNLVLSTSDQELLIQAAILLCDTIEGVVIPQLRAAADLGVWPATPVFDAVGVLRVGGTGNDIETLDRILQIDARGNDIYHNNAGGTTVLTDLDPRTLDIAAAVSIDLTGDDVYESSEPAQGKGAFGVGVLYDLKGDDSFHSGGTATTGGGAFGVGIFREAHGSDVIDGGDSSVGFGNQGVGYLRDDSGDDVYRAGSLAGGVANSNGLGLAWDRAGADDHWNLVGTANWGYAAFSGDGWWVDEGSGVDVYRKGSTLHPRACDGCSWSGSNGVQEGHGNDGRGGLAFLIAQQRRVP